MSELYVCMDEGAGRGLQSCRTEPLAFGIWHYLLVDSVSIEMNSWPPCWCLRIVCWCEGGGGGHWYRGARDGSCLMELWRLNELTHGKP